MADQANASTAATVFMDDIRSSMSGSYNYTPKDTSDKWIYAEIGVSSNGNLISALDFLGSTTSIATGDAVHWIAIKNISTTITDGIVISTENGTAAWNLVGGIVIGSGEMAVLKLCAPATTVAHIHAISVTMDSTGNYPTGTHSGTVNCQVAAVIDDL